MTKRINSRQKGASGEREFANWLRERGHVSARRGQQFSGGTDSPDVLGGEQLVGYHLEVKRVEAGNPYGWLDQAIRDAGDKTPVVMHRRNRRSWIAVVRAEDLMYLIERLNYWEKI